MTGQKCFLFSWVWLIFSVFSCFFFLLVFRLIFPPAGATRLSRAKRILRRERAENKHVRSWRVWKDEWAQDIERKRGFPKSRDDFYFDKWCLASKREKALCSDAQEREAGVRESFNRNSILPCQSSLSTQTWVLERALTASGNFNRALQQQRIATLISNRLSCALSLAYWTIPTGVVCDSLLWLREDSVRVFFNKSKYWVILIATLFFWDDSEGQGDNGFNEDEWQSTKSYWKVNLGLFRFFCVK